MSITIYRKSSTILCFCSLITLIAGCKSAELPPSAKNTDSPPIKSAVQLAPSWQYAEFSKINSGSAFLYRSSAPNRKNLVVCINPGHGTRGGASVQTLCHPDGSPKVITGSTAAGSLTAAAVSEGTVFLDGTPEAEATLALGLILKDQLLGAGYDVLLIRETEDVQLDNIARTVIANNTADCHISLHWDSTDTDKGVFYISVPSNPAYRTMEPVASHWESHHLLGESLLEGFRKEGIAIFAKGRLAIDLTQTSYSTIPSIDIELGDRASDHSAEALKKLSQGLTEGIELFFNASGTGVIADNPR